MSSSNVQVRSIPTDLWTWFKHEAVDRGCSLRALVIKALREFRTETQDKALMLVALKAGMSALDAVPSDLVHPDTIADMREAIDIAEGN